MGMMIQHGVFGVHVAAARTVQLSIATDLMRQRYRHGCDCAVQWCTHCA